MNPALYKAMYGYLLAPAEDSREALHKAAGEGSRGGKVIGHTRTGRPIYDSKNHVQHDAFTPEEHSDVKQKHQELETGKKYPANLKDQKTPTVAQQRKTYMPIDGGKDGRYDSQGLQTYKKILRLFKQHDAPFQGHVTYNPKTDEISTISNEAHDLIRGLLDKHQKSKGGASPKKEV